MACKPKKVCVKEPFSPKWRANGDNTSQHNGMQQVSKTSHGQGSIPWGSAKMGGLE